MSNNQNGHRPQPPKDRWKLKFDDLLKLAGIELPCFQGLEVVSVAEAGHPLN